MSPWLLFGTTFIASTVEMVEATTIVMAVGFTHGWRGALWGTAAALAALAAGIAIAGPLIETPLAAHWVEIVAGPFLLYLGATWLRKAILRYAGRKAEHDEDAIFARTAEHLRAQSARVGFATSFQGVLVEGLEVAIIVVTFVAGAPAKLPYSVGGALAAVVVVLIAAIALRAPLARVPENVMKSVVGVMLFSLGIFWTGEAVGVPWWKGDAMLAILVFAVALSTAASVALMRRTGARA